MKLRVFLFLLAAGMVYLIVRLVADNAAMTPDSLLLEARAHVREEPPNFDSAMRKLERAIDLARDEDARDAVSDLRVERIRLFRRRWDLSHENREVVHDDADLERVVVEGLAYLDEYRDERPEVLRLTIDSALDLTRPVLALDLLDRLERATSDAPALAALRGRAHEQRAAELLADLRARLDQDLSSLQMREVWDDIVAAAGRPDGDPRRTGLVDRLETRLSPAHFAAFEAAIEASYAETGLAGESYLDALHHTASGDAVAALQRVLTRAGSPAMAIDLGGLALERDDLTASTAVLVETVNALVAMGRTDRAIAVIRRAKKVSANDFGELTEDTHYAWCRLLHRLRLWPELAAAARELSLRVGRDRGHERLDDARFFQGLAWAMLGRVSEANRLLSQIELDESESLPGALLELHYALSLGAADSGEPIEQRKQLVLAIRAMPRDLSSPGLRLVAGETRYALGELSFVETDWETAERCFTYALALLPDRRDEITPLWREAGIAMMERLGRSEQRVKNAPWKRGLDSIYPHMGPYEACLRAEANLAEGRVSEVGVLLQPVLDEYPTLPNALVTRALASIQKNRFADAIEAQLTLAEAGFRDPALAEVVASIPPEAFRGEQVVRWTLRDPYAVGFARFLAGFERAGDSERLHAMLANVDPSSVEPRERVEAGRAALRTGRAELACKWFDAVSDEARELVSARADLLRAGLEATLATGFPKYVRNFSTRVAEFDAPFDARLLEAVDACIANGELDAARLVLESGATEGAPLQGEAMLRMALLHGLQREFSKAEDVLARAESMLDDEAVAFSRLVLASERAPGARLGEAATEYAAASPPKSAFERALLAALIGDDEAALRILGDDLGPADPRATLASWILAPARGGAHDAAGAAWPSLDRDESLVMLAATSEERFAAWALATLSRADEADRSTDAAAAVSALAWVTLGRPEHAEAILAARVGGRFDPLLSPMLEALVAQRFEREGGDRNGPTWTELWILRSRRFDALGPGKGSPDDVALSAALRFAAVGDQVSAYRTLVAAVAKSPENFDLWRELARIANRPQSRLRAYHHYLELCQVAPKRAAALLPEIIDVLRAAYVEGELGRAATAAEFDALEALFPGSPALPRELATLRLAVESTGVEWSVQRAWDHLERFRRRAQGKSMEASHPGETARWCRLYGRYDPERAVELAWSELSMRPESFELWRVWCAALVANGREQEALDAYDALLALVPDPEVLRERALLRFDRGNAAPADVRTVLRAELDEDAELSLRCSLALLGEKGGDRARGVALAEEIWRRRDALEAPIESYAVRLATGYGFAAREAALAVLDEAESSVLRSASEEIAWRATYALLDLPEAAPPPADGAPGAGGEARPGTDPPAVDQAIDGGRESEATDAGDEGDGSDGGVAPTEVAGNDARG